MNLFTQQTHREITAALIIKASLRAISLLGYDPEFIIMSIPKKKVILILSDTLQSDALRHLRRNL